MINWLVGTPCCFCGLRDGTQTVVKRWAYSTIRHTFHEQCRQRVLGNPEKYGNGVVDIALEIDECLSYEKRRREERLDGQHRVYEKTEQ